MWTEEVPSDGLDCEFALNLVYTHDTDKGSYLLYTWKYTRIQENSLIYYELTS